MAGAVEPPAPVYPSPPPHEVVRWEHTRKRRRMLYGQWREDLRAELLKAIGTVRAIAWKEPDLSSNVFLSVCTQLSVLYDRPPRIKRRADKANAKRLSDLLASAGWAPMMQRVQRDTIGLREMLIRVSVDVDGEVVLRPVFPDLVVAGAHPDCPDVPVFVAEARQRCHGEQTVWTWDVLDVSNPDAPSYRVMSSDYDPTRPGSGTDLSSEFLTTTDNADGDFTGALYPYKDASGAPILPYVLYHAWKGSELWDAYHGAELVEGTIRAGIYWSFTGHGMLRASWAQRWVVNARPVGGATDSAPAVGSALQPGETGRQVIVADPAIVAAFESADNGGDTQVQPQIGQWGPAADPDKMMAASVQYEQRVATAAGVSASDFVRTSGDPRSGYALAISREGQRQAALKYRPVFQDADARLCRTVAVLWNRATGATEPLPEDGYCVDYMSLPPSKEELDAVSQAITGGILDKSMALAMIGLAVDEDDDAPDAEPDDAEDAATPTQPGAAMPASAPQGPATPASAAAPVAEGVTPDGQPAIAPTAALNGAQVESALGICDKVAMRTMPRPDGVARLRLAFAMSDQMAEDFMGETGRTFFIDAPTPPAA